MKIKIHRGTHEIGGTCIEITANNGKTLLVDFGSPLSEDNPNIDYAENLKADAVLISHAHQDHYGLLPVIDRDTQIYIGKVSVELINLVNGFMGREKFTHNINQIFAWKQFIIDDTFKIFPYLVDHSSPEAFAFLIEVDGKRIFYSGDFRDAGYKKEVFSRLIKKPPKNIDLMFIEGTMIERDNQKYKTEEDIYDAFYDIFKNQNNVSFVLSSAQNVDRFISIFKACLKLNKTVVIDVYTAKILDIVKQNSKGLPVIDWNNIKVYNDGNQIKKLSYDKEFIDRINKNSIKNSVFYDPKNFVYFLRVPSKKLIEELLKKGGDINIVFSQWEGYLKKEHSMYYTPYINELKTTNNIKYSHIHTSGHATIDKLILLIKKLNPKQVVPIHTEQPEKLKKIFNDTKLSDIAVWEDKIEYSL